MSDVCALYTEIKKSNFEELIERGCSAYICPQNIRFLRIRIFKVFKGLSPQILKEIS